MYFFSKEVEVDGLLEDQLFIFFCGGLISVPYFKEKVQKAFSERVRPDRVILLYPEFLKRQVKEVIDQGGRVDIERYGDKVANDFIYFDSEGSLYFDYEINDVASNFLDAFGASYIVDAGMKALVENNRNRVFMSSPPGTLFIKPSGRSYKEFIKAAEIFSGFDEAVFVAFCVLVKVDKILSVEKIFADTDGFTDLFLALGYLYVQFNESSWPCEFENFKSYEGVGRITPIKAYNSAVIISASTSNTLSGVISRDWGVPESRILTVLGISKDGEQGSLLLDVRDYLDGDLDSSDDSSIKVKVASDNFAVEVGRPRRVVLERVFSPTLFSRYVEKHAEGGLFSVNKVIPGSLSAKSLFFDTSAVVDELDEWVKKVVEWYFPIGRCVLVYEGVEEDAVFVKLRRAVEARKPAEDIEIVSSDELVRSNDFVDGRSVIYFTPVVASGKRVLSVNRDLRIAGHKGNRIYLSVFYAYPSEARSIEFEKSISYAEPGFKYGFFYYKKFNSGRSFVKNPWDEELNFISKFKSEFWVKRKELLGKGSEGIRDQIGVRADGKSLRPDFTVGFAFWGGGYEPEKIKGAAIFALFSSMLSGLRDKPADQKGSLKSHAYQHAVIDPQNFWRFTDPLIQSSLWRAALPIELDYRGCEEMSAEIRDLILKYANDSLAGKQSSVVDLLLALGMGWMRVSKKALEQTLQRLPEDFKSEEYIGELVNAIKVPR